MQTLSRPMANKGDHRDRVLDDGESTDIDLRFHFVKCDRYTETSCIFGVPGISLCVLLPYHIPAYKCAVIEI